MEIKKAWEIMKKEIQKETGLCGGFTMSAKQIKNRTATYCVSTTASFEDTIAYQIRSIEMVKGYKEKGYWTEEEVARSVEAGETRIKAIEALREQYGTRENMVKACMEKIANSKAFEKFQNEVGETNLLIEEKENCYYIRFRY